MISPEPDQHKRPDIRSMRGGRAAQTGEPQRPCASCKNKFQPTVARRMLCLRCFKLGDSFKI